MAPYDGFLYLVFLFILPNRKNKIENKLFDSQINIIDNPRLKGKLRSRISDCEGIESNEKYLVKDGKLKYKEDFVEGLENVVEAFRGLLKGKNFGKLIIKLADEPN